MEKQPILQSAHYKETQIDRHSNAKERKYVKEKALKYDFFLNIIQKAFVPFMFLITSFQAYRLTLRFLSATPRQQKRLAVRPGQLDYTMHWLI